MIAFPRELHRHYISSFLNFLHRYQSHISEHNVVGFGSHPAKDNRRTIVIHFRSSHNTPNLSIHPSTVLSVIHLVN